MTESHPSLDEIEIRPQVGILRVFEAVDYKAWYALAEFVDNSIQSYLDNWEALVERGADGGLEVDITLGDEKIVIEDNAAGIPLDRFESAFAIGKPPPDSTGLSVYGIGMKSAAAWFSEVLEVSSVAVSENVARSVTLDFRAIVEGSQDSVPVTTRAIRGGQPTGTRVELRRLRHPVKTRTLDKVKRHLASIYRVFIRENDLVLRINGETVVHVEPDVLVAPWFDEESGEAIEWKKDIELELSSGEKVTGFAAIRSVGKVSGAGFSLYRQRRVITGLEDEPWKPMEIFGHSNSFKSQRIFGELHIEGVKVAYSKNAFVWTSPEDELIDLLREAMTEEPLDLLRQASNYRSRKSDPERNREAEEALINASEATKSSIEEDFPGEGDDNPPDPPGDDKGGQSKRYEFEVPFRNQQWLVRTSIESDARNMEFVTLADSRAAPDRDRRVIEVVINLDSPFMRSFGGSSREELEPFIRIGIASALAIVAAGEEGTTYSRRVLLHMNELLKGKLGSL